MDELDREFGVNNLESGHNWLGIAIVVGAFVGLFFLFRGPEKYEGQTAEEWFNDYDWVVACIEQHPNTAAEDCI